MARAAQGGEGEKRNRSPVAQQVPRSPTLKSSPATGHEGRPNLNAVPPGGVEIKPEKS